MPSLSSRLRGLILGRIPYGTNELGGRTVHKQRGLYKHLHSAKGNTIDFWYDQTLYGRVDEKGNAVYPAESNLKQFQNSEGVFALNFVVDAYEEFVADFVSKHSTEPLFSREKYLKPNGFVPKKGWLSVNAFFHNQMEGMYNGFFSRYIHNDLNRVRSLTSFDRFIKLFLEFLERVGDNSPLTRTAIITSLFCPPLISGLCVEFSSEDPSVDYNKHNDIFASRYYYSYRDSAVKYGFVIDKNIPWRLVADINSPKMQTFMRRYGVTPENLFERYYIKSCLYDIPALRIYLRQFYDSFITSQPVIRIPDGTVTLRAAMSDAEYERGYDADYWIWLYAKIRQSEVLNKLNKVDFDEIVQEAKNIRKYLDIRKAIGYINSNFLGQLVPTV